MGSVLRRGAAIVAGVLLVSTVRAGPLEATTAEWAATWCAAIGRFEDAYDEADELGNELYTGARSDSGGLAALKRKLATAAGAARKIATDAVDDLETVGAPDGPEGTQLQADAQAAFERAAQALKKARAKLNAFDPSDPVGTLKALRSAGSLGAAGKAEDAISDFEDALDDARAADPALDQALVQAGCS
jgi:tetratricopeptide (TPR) repeat protein